MGKIHLGFSHEHVSSLTGHFHFLPREDSALHARSRGTSEPASLTGRNSYSNSFGAFSRGYYQCRQRFEASTWIESLDRSRCSWAMMSKPTQCFLNIGVIAASGSRQSNLYCAWNRPKNELRENASYSL
jgi:hypothetical protein